MPIRFTSAGGRENRARAGKKRDGCGGENGPIRRALRLRREVFTVSTKRGKKFCILWKKCVLYYMQYGNARRGIFAQGACAHPRSLRTRMRVQKFAGKTGTGFSPAHILGLRAAAHKNKKSRKTKSHRRRGTENGETGLFSSRRVCRFLLPFFASFDCTCAAPGLPKPDAADPKSMI